MRTPAVAANWKMFKTTHEALAYVRELGALVKDVSGVEIIVAPPFTALTTAAEAARNTAIGIAAQNMSAEKEGAFTGEVSVGMLKEAGAEGASLTFYVTDGGSGMLDPVAMGAAIQADLAEVGLDVTIET